jgi:hypothetical protein
MYEKRGVSIPKGFGHWWNGWPGAYCMKCGAEDPSEYAVAHYPIDYETGEIKFPDQAAYDEWYNAHICPVKDDPDKHPWLSLSRGI